MFLSLGSQRQGEGGMVGGCSRASWFLSDVGCLAAFIGYNRHHDSVCAPHTATELGGKVEKAMEGRNVFHCVSGLNLELILMLQMFEVTIFRRRKSWFCNICVTLKLLRGSPQNKANVVLVKMMTYSLKDNTIKLEAFRSPRQHLFQEIRAKVQPGRKQLNLCMLNHIKIISPLKRDELVLFRLPCRLALP